MACPEALPESLVPPGAGQESFGHPLLPRDPQPEPESQKPHLLEENGEDLSQGTLWWLHGEGSAGLSLQPVGLGRARSDMSAGCQE